MTNQLAGQAMPISEISSRIPQSAMTAEAGEEEEGFGDDNVENSNVENKTSLLPSKDKLFLFTAEKKL